jgi:hypothetical protein
VESSPQLFRQGLLLSLLCVILFIIANHEAAILPEGADVIPEVSQNPPEQGHADITAFAEDRNGVRYDIYPRNSYSARGVIVAEKGTTHWGEILHFKFPNYLNTANICISWGSNTQGHILNDFQFSNDEHSCKLETLSSESYKMFSMGNIANHILIPSNTAIGRTISEANVGDQIEMNGYLVDYTTNGENQRTSSKNEKEVSNEILYVTEFKTLKRTSANWQRLRSIGISGAVLSILITLFAFFILPLIYDLDY